MTLEEYTKKVGLSGEPPYTDAITKKFKKGQDLCSIGEIEQNIYFIVSGIVEIGMVAKNEDKILEFVFPQNFTSNFTSLLLQKPADSYLTCLTDCVVEIIPFSEMRNATKTSLKICQHYIRSIELAYVARVKKEKDFMLLSAEERYLKLIKTRPEITQQIPVYRIAKYLGIHPDSLSRIKKKLSSAAKKNEKS